jgi:integrase
VRRLYIGCEPPLDKTASGNYLVLRRNAANGSLAGEIILNEYKTSKTYGQRRMELPMPYIHTLLASLDQNPRQYLFCMEQSKRVAANTPYCENSFGKWANNTLNRLFGRPLTLSGVRHSFISAMHCSQYWAGLSDAQREQIATQMGHSFSTACKYRWVGVR